MGRKLGRRGWAHALRAVPVYAPLTQNTRADAPQDPLAVLPGVDRLAHLRGWEEFPRSPSLNLPVPPSPRRLVVQARHTLRASVMPRFEATCSISARSPFRTWSESAAQSPTKDPPPSPHGTNKPHSEHLGPPPTVANKHCSAERQEPVPVDFAATRRAPADLQLEKGVVIGCRNERLSKFPKGCDAFQHAAIQEACNIHPKATQFNEGLA